MLKAASAPEPGTPLTAGFDVGGTNIRAALVAPDGTCSHRINEKTPQDAKELEDLLVQLVGQLNEAARAAGYGEVAAVGIAIAGFIDPTCECVRFAPHLPWRDAPVRRTMHERLGVPVRIEHDANAAAWGEYRFGAGRGVDEWVFVSIGTGIGAAIIHDGELYRGAHGTAPEFGHIVVDPSPHGRTCSCGKRGCLERYASGTALPDTTRELRPKYETALPADAAGREVTDAARAGDRLGQAVMHEFGVQLGRGLSIVADVLDPQLIVVGGGVADDADLFLGTACETMRDNMVGAGYRPVPTLATTELGGPAGMIGVADLARSALTPKQ